MKEQYRWRNWGLAGLEVTQLRFDYRFHVHMWSLDRDLLISFGAPVRVISPAGESRAFDPERGETLCPLLPLLHRRPSSPLLPEAAVGSDSRVAPSCGASRMTDTRRGSRTGLAISKRRRYFVA